MKYFITTLSLFVTLSTFAQTPDEAEMFNLINEVRTNPKSFVPVVEAYIADLNTVKIINVNGVKMTVTKKVDQTLVKEAKELIKFLNTAKPVSSLSLSKATYDIAKKQVVFMDSTKQVTHNGPNGVTFAERTKGFLIGENCTAGNNAKQAMLLLLLDYRAIVKGHRNNILNPQYTKVSVAKSGNYWVQDFTY